MTERRNRALKKRILMLMLTLCLLLAARGFALTVTRPAQSTGGLRQAVNVNTALANEVVRQVNLERGKRGLGALRISPELSRASKIRAMEITRVFSHTRPDGTAWRTVSSAAYGENIAMGQRTADKVMAAWMTSSGHRANILRPSYGSIGVCVVTSNGVTYWVQLFGR